MEEANWIGIDIEKYFGQNDVNKDQQISVEEVATPLKKSCRSNWDSKDEDYDTLASKFVAQKW